MQLVDRILRQVEHRVAQPRIGARIAELGDDRRLLGGKQPADGVHEGPHDLLVLAERRRRPAEDPVEGLVVGPLQPRRPRGVEVAHLRARADEEGAVHEHDQHHHRRHRGAPHSRKRRHQGEVEQRAQQDVGEQDDERGKEGQRVARLSEVHQRVDEHGGHGPPDEEPLAGPPAVAPDVPGHEQRRQRQGPQRDEQRLEEVARHPDGRVEGPAHDRGRLHHGVGQLPRRLQVPRRDLPSARSSGRTRRARPPRG